MNDIFDDLPEQPCSMARQLTVMVGTLSAAGAIGVLLAIYVGKRWLHL